MVDDASRLFCIIDAVKTGLGVGDDFIKRTLSSEAAITKGAVLFGS